MDKCEEKNEVEHNDESLIYKLLQQKQQINTQQPMVNIKQSIHDSKQEMFEEKQDYGELIEVQTLQFNHNITPPEIQNLEHIQEDNRIKVFIDPNPQHFNKKKNKQQQHIPNNHPISSKQREEELFQQYATLPKEQKGNKETQIRIKDIPKNKQIKNRKSNHINKDSIVSRPSSASLHSETDSFEEFKEYKKRKRNHSMRALMKKVEGLQRKVIDLSQKNRELKERRPIYYQGKGTRGQTQIISNLINIKVDSHGLKEDILKELKKIKEKVDILENKSIQQSQNYRKNKTDLLDGLAQAMAESKIESQSRLNMSRERQKNCGKIFRKSQVRAEEHGQFQIIENKPEKQHVEISRKQVDMKKQSEIESGDVLFNEVQQNMNERDSTQQQIKNNVKTILKEEGQHKGGFQLSRDAISLSKQKKKHEEEKEIIQHEIEQLETEQNQGQRYEGKIKLLSKKKEQKLSDNARKEEEISHELNSSPIGVQPKVEGKSHSQGGFVRSGGNRIAPIKVDGNESRQDWQQSLKMLQFDTGRQKFVVESNHTEDSKLPSLKTRQINSFQEAEAILPTIPSIINIPTFETEEEQLIEMGKQLFSLFIQEQLNYNQIVLKVKKYKNCVYFGLDTERNILMHYEGRIYFGGWREYMNGEGEKTGQGIEWHPGKFIYKGQFKEGKRNGFGALKVMSNNRTAVYVGQFMEGAKHGDGKQFEQNGVYYHGEWKQNKKDGRGKLVLSEHEIYEGTFLSGLKSGYGVQIFKNGDKYEGNYIFGKFQGQGVYRWANGAIYRGEFKGGMRNGMGIWSSQEQNGDVYEGYYKDDMKHGKGKYKWANGASYDGEFFNDQKHGKGIVTHENGKISALEWEKGEVIKPLQQDHKEELSQTKIRNYNKSLSVNKKFITSREKEKHLEHKLISNHAFNKLTLSNASNSLPKGVGTHSHSSRQFKHPHEQVKQERHKDNGRINERPMTSKSLNSVSNSTFKLQRKHEGRGKQDGMELMKNGFPQDPPYRGIRPSANIVNF